MPEVNKELLLRVLEEIEKFPETHYQGTWFRPLDEPVPGPGGELCKTAFCFAGHAAVMDGVSLPVVPAELPYQAVEWRVDQNTKDSILIDITGDDYDPPVGSEPVEGYARDVLGLDPESANCLFSGRNSRELLRAMVEHIIEHGSITTTEWSRLRYRLQDAELQRRSYVN